MRQRNLKCPIAPFKRDTPIINTVLGPEARAEWEEQCLEIEIASFPNWKRACELWNQANWVSKRVALAGDTRAEVAGQQAFAHAMPAPIMAMSLDQPVTIALPTHILETEPISPPITQETTEEGRTMAELNPDHTPTQPTAGLNIPKTSNAETTMTAMPPRRRASVSTANNDAVKEADREKLRRNSAQ